MTIGIIVIMTTAEVDCGSTSGNDRNRSKRRRRYTLSYLCVGIRIAERRLLNNRYERGSVTTAVTAAINNNYIIFTIIIINNTAVVCRARDSRRTRRAYNRYIVVICEDNATVAISILLYYNTVNHLRMYKPTFTFS